MHYANEPFPEAQKPNTWTGKHLVLVWLALFKAAGQGSPSFAQETSIREILIAFQPEEKYNGKWRGM